MKKRPVTKLTDKDIQDLIKEKWTDRTQKCSMITTNTKEGVFISLILPDGTQITKKLTND